MPEPSDPADKVGYRRPPAHSRFKPGMSGNPRGRQRGVRNFATDLKRTLEMPVNLNENGKSKRVSTQEALMLRLREKALKGDARALDTLRSLAKTHNIDFEGAGEDRPLAQDDQTILDAFLEEAMARQAPATSSADGVDAKAPDGKNKRQDEQK